MSRTVKDRRAQFLGVVTALILAGVTTAAARLYPEAAMAWTTYTTATERRVAAELADSRRFLAMDFSSDAAADRRAVLGGEIVIRHVDTLDSRGQILDVPSALVHHWRGAILIPHVTLNDVMARLQSGGPAAKQEDVLDSRVLERGPDRMRIYLKLQRTKFVTVVYNTEHLVTFKRLSPTRATSASTATKIAELEDVGTPREHELPPGDDRGFLWRLNAYWRYEEVPGGVIAECESITLSRTIPSVVLYVVSPLIDSAARESMTRTLQSVTARF